MPWQFHAKLTAVVLLTVVVAYVAWLERLAHRGDPAAMARMGVAGKVAATLALISTVFAVLTFD